MIVTVLSSVFVALSVGALLFFIHKVVWLVRYKQLQRMLVAQAHERLVSTESSTLPEWDAFAAKCWRVARDSDGDDQRAGPASYVKQVELRLARVLESVERSRKPVRPLLRQACLEAIPQTHTVLETPLGDETRSATLRLEPPAVSAAAPLSADLYELNIKSRYSFFRRALVFCAGIADVVYSSQHIAKMSAYTDVPLGIIVRRLSLVVLLVVGIILEVVLGLRAELEAFLGKHVLPQLPWVREADSAMQSTIASATTLVLWTAAVAGIYFTMFLLLRRRYRENVKALDRLREAEPQRLSAIQRRHNDRLMGWANEYGKTLDAALDLTAKHINMLGRHYARRVRRRMAGARLLRQAKRISEVLFQELPESTGTLQDVATTRQRSFRHALWPNVAEMTDVVQIAQYREAWQYVEIILNELRRSQPDPDQIAGFWRQLVTYAVMFADVLPADTLTELRRAYLRLAEETSEETEEDLASFERAVGELIGHLNEQLAAATPLLQARIELTNQRIQAAVARFQAEVIQARERARHEAMAFEI